MNFKIKTAIVILNWNGKVFLAKFLHNIISSVSSIEAQVIVVDNGSTDGSVDWVRSNCPSAGLILFDTNYGFTKGYNQALKQIDSEYYVLLNSDVNVPANWLQPLIEHLDTHLEDAACAPKIRSFHSPENFEYAGAGGGFIDKYGYPFCRGRILDNIETDNGQYDSKINVFWASGAAFAVRAELFHKAGGLDSDFFAHMEEIDLCWRLQLMGYKISSIPDSVVYHIGGGVLPNNSPRKLYLNYRNNLLMLLKNTYKNLFTTIIIRLVLDGCSGIVYLVSGKFASFFAVIKAHYAFFIRIPLFLKKRRLQKPMFVENPDLKIYKGFVIFRYFKSGKSLTFSDLKIEN
ncbi:MAG: glycosyltransferase family 2 protein [Prevotellaceae bacterium]|jgi:GT2 family glycosyltransferase|nr:glycosyltransferase family 2 protein [Prevotellaceae bacterium]